MGRLTDKVAIITGGASGMGREMVDLFTKEGAQVIAADINEKAVAAVHGTVLDVSSDESWKKVTDEVIAKFGQIDILVNNAGISTEKGINDTTLADWQLMLGINGFGPFLGMKHVVPHMAKEGKGAVVNISSFTAQIGMGLNSYSASKGAVRAISKAAATQYGRMGVRVNAVFPGIIETPMTQKLEESKELVNQMIKATPLQRLGQPADIANAVLYLASDEASYVTGAELVIDGGYSAQ
ncbi:tungsten formylmethanofuran dehydrogenase [Bacillus sp. AFS043905]|uniref:SDR family NAD(P)-dependent oxidoreductase n=1 Tax=Peribacillus frigoritolerans TaxID=450367 RepID=UPI000BFE4B31|nr:glucose 1-dehydrogenase [Peribacillus frigoritolerans]PHD78634.1 tungsten formylmethanofuran dehydrogenase [Bacillus sp. AFS043905]TWE03886.1 NAD(P)-dependent dehydrogenase (short-subunit alcohol dehydrogenase family) [Peribacillus frigoritolerans]